MFKLNGYSHIPSNPSCSFTRVGLIQRMVSGAQATSYRMVRNEDALRVTVKAICIPTLCCPQIPMLVEAAERVRTLKPHKHLLRYYEVITPNVNTTTSSPDEQGKQETNSELVDALYIVSEEYAGSLKDVIVRTSRFQSRFVESNLRYNELSCLFTLLRGVLAAAKQMHYSGLVHSQICLSCIMETPDCVWKLDPFGLPVLCYYFIGLTTFLDPGSRTHAL